MSYVCHICSTAAHQFSGGLGPTALAVGHDGRFRITGFGFRISDWGVWSGVWGVWCWVWGMGLSQKGVEAHAVSRVGRRLPPRAPQEK